MHCESRFLYIGSGTALNRTASVAGNGGSKTPLTIQSLFPSSSSSSLLHANSYIAAINVTMADAKKGRCRRCASHNEQMKRSVGPKPTQFCPMAFGISFGYYFHCFACILGQAAFIASVFPSLMKYFAKSVDRNSISDALYCSSCKVREPP